MNVKEFTIVYRIQFWGCRALCNVTLCFISSYLRRCSFTFIRYDLVVLSYVDNSLCVHSNCNYKNNMF